MAGQTEQATAQPVPGARIVMRCRVCTAEKEYRPGNTRVLLKVNATHPGRVTIDESAGRGEYVCRTCSYALVGRKTAKRRRKARDYDNRLKGYFADELEHRDVSELEAARQMGVAAPTLSAWRQRPTRRLADQDLRKLAAWFPMPYTDAVRLQGGRSGDPEWVKERSAPGRRAAALKVGAKGTPNVDRKRREHGQKIAATVTGSPKDPEHGEALANHLARVRASPKWQANLKLHNATARTRAHRVLSHICRRAGCPGERSPEHQQHVDLAVERLQREPYFMASDWARGMFAPLPRRGKKPPGPKPDPRKCKAFQAHALERGWPGWGELPEAFDADLAERLGEATGRSLTYKNAREWRVDDVPTCRDCLLKIADARQKDDR